MKKKKKRYKNPVFSTLSECWIETAFLFFTEMAAVMLVVLLFVLFVKNIYPYVDFSDPVSAIMRNYGIVIAAAVFFTVGFVIITPLYYGVKWCYFQAAGGKPAPVSGAFFGYLEPRRWFTAIALSAITFVRKAVIYIPSGIVSVAGIYISAELCSAAENEITQAFMRVGCAVLLFGAFIIYMFLTVKYEIVPFVYAEDPVGNPFELFRRGVSLMEGSNGEYSSMIARYIPLMALCVMGFPAIILIPVFSMAKALSVVRIVEKKQNISLSESGSDGNGEKSLSDLITP